jgi:hypothetical protein
MLYHRFEFVALVDDGAQAFRLFRKIRGCMRLYADRILGEQLFLRGFELTLAAKLD